MQALQEIGERTIKVKYSGLNSQWQWWHDILHQCSTAGKQQL